MSDEKPTLITITRVTRDEVGNTDDFDYEVMDDQTEFLWHEGTPAPPPGEYAPDEGRYTDANGVEWRRFDDAWFRESTDTVALVDNEWRDSVFEEVGPLGPKVGEKFHLWTDRYDFYSAFVSHAERAPEEADQ